MLKKYRYNAAKKLAIIQEYYMTGASGPTVAHKYGTRDLSPRPIPASHRFLDCHSLAVFLCSLFYWQDVFAGRLVIIQMCLKVRYQVKAINAV